MGKAFKATDWELKSQGDPKERKAHNPMMNADIVADLATGTFYCYLRQNDCPEYR